MRVFVIHGSLGNPQENWIPWLKESLSENNIECDAPFFPTPLAQNYDDWSELLDYYVDKGYIDNETVLVGHSCSSIFIPNYIVEKGIDVKAIIGVAGYNNFMSGNEYMDNLNKSFYCDNEKLSTINQYVKNRISYYSNNDPFIPKEKLVEYTDIISAKSFEIDGAGHFNTSSGYNKFEHLLDIILKI